MGKKTVDQFTLLSEVVSMTKAEMRDAEKVVRDHYGQGMNEEGIKRTAHDFYIYAILPMMLNPELEKKATKRIQDRSKKAK